MSCLRSLRRRPPLTDRFSPSAAIRAHFAALAKRDYSTRQVRNAGSDWVAIFVLYAVPVLLGVAAWLFSWRLASVDPLLAGSALLVGGLVAGFAQIASWRDRLTLTQDSEPKGKAAKRDSLDESVAHILVAIYAATLLTILLAVDANVLAMYVPAKDEVPMLGRGLSSSTIALSSYLLFLMFLVLANLWSAYSDSNEVPRRMGGAD